MRKKLRPVVAASALAAALLTGTALYAHEDSPGGPGQMMRPGMMGQSGMMGQGGMMGMMNMMATCDNMMQGMMQHHQGEPQKPREEPENKD